MERQIWAGALRGPMKDTTVRSTTPLALGRTDQASHNGDYVLGFLSLMTVLPGVRVCWIFGSGVLALASGVRNILDHRSGTTGSMASGYRDQLLTKIW